MQSSNQIATRPEGIVEPALVGARLKLLSRHKDETTTIVKNRAAIAHAFIDKHPLESGVTADQLTSFYCEHTKTIMPARPGSQPEGGERSDDEKLATFAWKGFLMEINNWRLHELNMGGKSSTLGANQFELVVEEAGEKYVVKPLKSAADESVAEMGQAYLSAVKRERKRIEKKYSALDLDAMSTDDRLAISLTVKGLKRFETSFVRANDDLIEQLSEVGGHIDAVRTGSSPRRVGATPELPLIQHMEQPKGYTAPFDDMGD